MTHFRDRVGLAPDQGRPAERDVGELLDLVAALQKVKEAVEILDQSGLDCAKEISKELGNQADELTHFITVLEETL